MKPIVTLTMNPAVDLATAVKELVDERKLRCETPRYDPGGGGINVARVICRLGGTATALCTCGGPPGTLLQQLLAAEDVACHPLPVAEPTRQNFMVHEQSTRRRFRFVLPGPTLTEDEWQRCLQEVSRAVADADYIVASGSLPPGVPDDFYARVAHEAKRHAVRVVLDTSGAALAPALDEGVYMIKPNKDEITELAGQDLPWPGGQRAFAAELVGRGAAEVVVISRGEQGALLVARDLAEIIPAPAVEVVSAVGAGDSFVAGMCLGLAWGWSVVEACRFGTASAGATLLTPGTELCRRDDAERLYRGIGGRHDLRRRA